MKDSLILEMVLKIYGKLVFYYKNSGLFMVLQRIGQSFGKYAANSCILNFFDKEWNIESAWRKSIVFRMLILPLRLFKYASNSLSDGTNSALEGSKALNGIKLLLESMFKISTRVYGLFLLTFAAAHGLLALLSGNGLSASGTGTIIRLALFIAGTVMILVDRPVKSLVEGSIAGRIGRNYFIISGSTSSDAAGDAGKSKSFEIAAAAAGVLLGMAGYLLPLKIFVLAVGAIAGSILVLWKHEIGVFAVVGLIPIAPTMALMGLILITAVSYGIRLFRDKAMSFRITILDYFVVLFGIVLLYSTFTSYTPNNSILTLFIYAACILFYFILVNTIKTRQQLYAVTALIILSTTLISLYGLYQLKAGGATSEAWVDTTLFEDIKARVGSTFENPNVLGEYLVLVIPLAAAMLWGQRRWAARFLTMAMAAVVLLCLIYTYSRGAYLGLMMAFALFAVLKDKRFVILGIAGLMVLPFVLPPSVINRFTSIGNLSDTSSLYRISVWIGSLRIVQDYWPSGIGLGLEPFKFIYPKYSLNAAYAHHSHNIYIQMLIETGIAGFLIFLSMMVVYYKTMLAGFYKTRDGFISTFMIAIASGMAGYLVQGMVENLWYNNRVLLTFWVMLALGMIAKSLISKDNEVLDI